MPRYSREDALSERELELLLRAAREMEPPRDFETRLIINLTAKMGLRSGEAAHLRAEWVNTHDRMIEIPQYDPCDFGKGDHPCGYCRNRARDYLDTHNTTIEAEARALRDEFGDDLPDDTFHEKASERVAETNISFEDALDRRWNPKTPNSERSIPFDHDVRVQLCIERFVDEYDKFPVSKATLNRRVNRAAEIAGISHNVYPHALRATAGSLFAARNVSPYALMGILGWQDMETARSYISASDESAARELRSKHR